MEMETKFFRMAIKEVGAEGTFRGYLSVFGNVDQGGDMVEAGAFIKTLNENRAFPLLWAHSAQDPHNVVGSFHGQEDKRGLLIDGEFNLDNAGGKEAYGTVRYLHSKGAKVGLSIGYKAEKWQDERKDGDGYIRHLQEIKLYEGSLTLFPMNDQALVEAVKQNLETKPSAENHVCRLGSGDYIRYRSETRKHDGKTYTVRFGITKDGKAEEYEYFYPVGDWTAAAARSHCKSHDGKFEAATGKAIRVRCGSCGETVMEIYDPVLDKDMALDTTEPDATTPKDEPPDDGRAANMAALRNLLKGIKSKKGGSN